MRLYDGVAFWVERHGTDGRPVACVTRPACRIKFASSAVQRMPGSQDRVIVPCMALSRTDVTNTAVTMVNVVPMHETGCPGAGAVEVGEPLGGELRPVLGRAKQRFRISVVVAHAGSRVRGLDSPAS